MIDTDFSISATALARALQDGDITAEQVMRDCIERIDAREPEVKAWTFLDREAALAQARALDRGPITGPLHGLPLGVKDVLDTADMPTGYGSPIYPDHHPAADAGVVALCRHAGAIVLGKTVTTEFATYTAGPTRNPHNTQHTPGGSSSGSAAAVGDGMVPIAFGTQTAGSILRPAAYCGVVGFKPSFGRVTRVGAKSLGETLDTLGGFGKNVDDAALLASVMTGDPTLRELAYDGRPRIGMMRTHDWAHALPETIAAFELAAERLAAAGATVSEAVMPDSCMGLTEAHGEVMAFEARRALAHEYQTHPELLSERLRQILESGEALPYERYRAHRLAAKQARWELDGLFQQFDILLAPTAAGEAPLASVGTGDPMFCRTWTLLGVPCVHLPFAQGPTGLPVGLQAIGRFSADTHTFKVARWAHQRLN
jgi:Asp-tRNA(Asn)/Glu-tRNA(Gln) amidotransferase A subunit family amidase